ncbi:hypothetical protein LTR04_002845 [Oleoguttula sp. CCFEE 6159]|nr:hypothetical protein LTR04_002845 [Oleoguttula sp. CCFEE 6159]
MVDARPVGERSPTMTEMRSAIITNGVDLFSHSVRGLQVIVMLSPDDELYRAALFKDVMIVLCSDHEATPVEALKSLLEITTRMAELRKQIVANAVVLYSGQSYATDAMAHFELIIVHDSPGIGVSYSARVLKNHQLCIKSDLRFSADDALTELFETSAKLMYEKFGIML